MKHARNIAQDGSKHMKIQIMMHILDENNAEIIIKELQRLVRGFEIVRMALSHERECVDP